MKNGKGILALEELAEDTPAADADRMEQTLLDSERSASEVLQATDQVEESVGIAEVLETTADQLDAAADSGQEIPETSLVAIESFLKYASARLGCPKPISIGLENYSKSNDRATHLRRVAAEARRVQHEVEKRVLVAQEGLVSGFVKLFENGLEGVPELKSRLTSVVEQSNAVDGKSGQDFAAHWVKDLGSSTTATYGTVLAVAKQYQNTFSNGKLASALKRTADCVKKGTKEVRGIWFWSNSKEIERLQEAVDEVVRIQQDVATNLFSTSHNDKAKVLSKKEAQELGEVVVDILDSTDLDKYLTEIATNGMYSLFWKWFNHGFRIKNGVVSILTGGVGGVIGVHANMLPIDNSLLQSVRDVLTAEDLAKASNITSKSVAIRTAVVQMLQARKRFAHAVIRYIDESSRARQEGK